MEQVKTLLLNAKQIEQRINRIAYEIYEDNSDEKEIIIAGIANGGLVFAKQLEKVINKICDLKTQLVKLTLDKENPVVNYSFLYLSSLTLTASNFSGPPPA